MSAPQITGDRHNRIAAVLGLAAGGLAAVGAFLEWFTITIGGVAAPGGSATGLEGRDGRTVLAGAVVAIAAAVLIGLDTRRLAPKIALIVAGFIVAVIAVAGILDTSGKADAVQDEFAIPAGRVVAEVGTGLWVVAVAGVLGVAAGVVAHPPERDGKPATGWLGRRAAGSAGVAAR